MFSLHKAPVVSIRCLLARVSARGRVVDSDNFIGLRHCSARATTCVHGTYFLSPFSSFGPYLEY